MKAAAILCQTATVADRQLFIHGGGWNAIQTTGPVPLAVAGVISAREEDLGGHEIELVLSEESGGTVTIGEGATVIAHKQPFVLKPPIPGSSLAHQQSVLRLGSLACPWRQGGICSRIRVDGEIVATTPFQVSLPDKKAAKDVPPSEAGS